MGDAVRGRAGNVRNVPVSRLKSVVFPAPLGPMIECSVPASMSRLTSLTAVRAPNDLLTFFVFKIIIYFEKRRAMRVQASTTPPRKNITTITNASPRRSGQRAHSTLTDSDSQMKTKEPMIGP